MKYIENKKKELATLFVILAIISLLIIFSICLAKPKYFKEKKAYNWNCYHLELNEKGEFCLLDYLIRNGRDFKRYGKYRIFFSLIILEFDDGRKIVFLKSNDSLVFDMKKSKGMEDGRISIEDHATWTVSDVFYEMCFPNT